MRIDQISNDLHGHHAESVITTYAGRNISKKLVVVTVIGDPVNVFYKVETKESGSSDPHLFLFTTIESAVEHYNKQEA